MVVVVLTVLVAIRAPSATCDRRDEGRAQCCMVRKRFRQQSIAWVLPPLSAR
jgi:hypothetical protein